MIDAAGLRVMRAIADNGSFTAAATSLGYTQPAISQMVRRLEQRIGTPLVERRGRTVALTEAGQVLAEHAAKILGQMERAESDIAALAGLRAGRVRLMAFPSSSATLVPRALASLKASYPDIRVTMTEAEPTESLAALAGGMCDLVVAFAYDEEPWPREDLVAQPLLNDPLMVVLPEDHPLAASESLELADLRDEPWIAGCPQCRGHLVSHAQQCGFLPRVDYETEDYVAVLALVRAGLGVALVPQLILRATRTEGIAVRPLSNSSSRRIEVVTTSDLHRVPAVRAMLEALCAAAEEMSVRAETA